MKKAPQPQVKPKPDPSQGFFVQGVSAKSAPSVNKSAVGNTGVASKAPVNQVASSISSSSTSSSLSNSQIHKSMKPTNPQKGVPLKPTVQKQNAIKQNSNSGSKQIQVDSEKIKIDNSPKKVQQTQQEQKKQQSLVEEKKVLNQQVEQQIQQAVTQKQVQQVEYKVEVVKQEPVKGKVTIKYNHYNNQFDIVDGRLSFAEIDEQYCFSFVFKGNYLLKLKHATSKEISLPINKIYQNLVDGQTYIAEITEDEDEVKKESSKPYYASMKEDGASLKQNARINNLTNELKGMNIEELKQKGDKYKELIEARDLEDILYK